MLFLKANENVTSSVPPSVALSGDVTITHEQQILDSLQRIDKKVELKK